MAEKQLAYRAGGKDEFFADDDPLAELARIVGFDQRPATPVAANQRQEPAFDLEDELLREFERYDAPRAPAAAPQAPVASAAPAYPEPGNRNELPSEPAAVAAQAFSPEPSSVHEPQAVQAEAVALPVPDEGISGWSPAEESWDQVIEPATMPIDATPIETHSVATPVGGARDLIEELELSIGSAPIVEPAAAKTPQWAAASIRLPLANFNAARRDPPVVAAPVLAPTVDIPAPAPVADFVAPSVLAYPAELDRHEFAPAMPVVVEPVASEAADSGFDLVAAARDGAVHADAALTEAAYPAEASLPGLDIDDLLADVSRYPVPTRQETAARLDPAFGAAAEPRVAEPAPVSVAAPVVEAPVHQPVAETVAEGQFDSFDDHDFDLDLADIELELAELDLSEPEMALHVPETPPQHVSPADDDWHQPATVAAPAASYAVAPAVAIAETLAPRPSSPAVAAMADLDLDLEQELPFDPAGISDTEDRVESFEDMHVPVLPPVEPDEPVAAAPDYDFDIDAEMANLFNPPAAETPDPVTAEAIGEAVAVRGSAAAVARAAATQKPTEGLDEFERALEEDFRRSFRETTGRPENVSQVMFESSHTANDRWRARSMRGIAIAAAAIVVVGGCAYGMYGWVSHGGSSLGFTSGEPRVIAADKEPIKVVPTDPGGKVVPNQDKAVYDRVAGAATQPPKQKELVTSDEQPVDVVQRTLIPETTLPDDSDGNADGADGDNQPLSTPVGETEDPRLLPNQGNTAAAANGQDGNSAVSPRRVRTMIVKPDGTLVAREEGAPADDSAAPAATTPALASATKPATGSSPAEKSVASADDSDAPNAESAPIRMVKTTQLANATDAAPPAANPPATTAPASDAAPIPTARPIQTAMATPAPATPKPAAAAKPIQTAAANPQPAKTVPAAAVSAGGYVMQIASLPSEDEAKRSQANLSAKFAGVLGGHPIEVRKVDIAGKGTYYRVRVAAGSKDDAAALCVRFRAAGGTCLISK